MKINPVKNPKKPDYPDLNELSRKKKSKKLVAFLAALASLATTLTGCQVQGDVAYEGVAMPPVETEELAGNVELDGAVAVETTEEVQLMGETAVDWINYDIYELTEDGNYSAVATDQGDYVTDISYTLSDGVSMLTIYNGEFDIFSNVSVSELRENKFFNISYPEDYYELYSTIDGDVIVLSPDGCVYDVVVEEEIALAGDVVAPDESVTIAGSIGIATPDDNACTVPTEPCDTELAGDVAIVTTDGE